MKRLMILLGGIACILLAGGIGSYAGDRIATRLVVEPTATPKAWESIPLPKGVQPDHFIVSYTPFAHVVATNGKIYHNPCFNDDKNWTEGEIKNGLGGSCELYSFGAWYTDFPDLPRTSKSQSYCLLPGDFNIRPTQTNLAHACLYAILDNGELVRWDTTAWNGSRERPTSIPTKSVMHIETVNSFTVCGGLIGLLAVILVSVVANHSKQR
ncbi:MAG TPA: hypothetical protein VLG46_09230 [Anaerolineae bacterium]|nr:hypothetical protein [Anaerolineae bacterium]